MNTRTERTRRELEKSATATQPLISEYIDTDPAVQTITRNNALSRSMAVFAGSSADPSDERHQIKGATYFLNALIKAAEQNADRSKFGRR
jgi:hypothetical protein